MKTILLFGAGKSATVLIDYLLVQAQSNDWKLIIADTDKNQVLAKTGHSLFAEAVEIDITDANARAALIPRADIVLSLLPPQLHFLIAKDCVHFGKHLLTASYIDEQLKALKPGIEEKGLLFIGELGLDPGIDHMSAMQRIDEIKSNGGCILSFKSHCGGLVAPENNNNPWKYKISWNPKNVVMAGKAGATYKINGRVVQETYDQLFNNNRKIEFPGLGSLCFYPNRDSIEYSKIYGLETADDFMRTTLRYPDFMTGWAAILALKLTDENDNYDTNGLSIQAFFETFFHRHAVNSSTILNTPLLKEQFEYLGLNDNKTAIDKGVCDAATILQFILENKLILSFADKDMIALLHEFIYESGGKRYLLQSSLVVTGENSLRTAMAKTVGLPLGIATKLILNGDIRLTGLHIPIVAAIYNPILLELKKYGIEFNDTTKENPLA